MSMFKDLNIFKNFKSDDSDLSYDFSYEQSSSNTIVCRKIKFNSGLWVLLYRKKNLITGISQRLISINKNSN